MAKKQLHVFWSGNVQGVGFRFTVERVALNLGLKGWVKNVPDRRVEAVCEGEEGILKNFLDKVNSEMNYYIRNVDTDWLAPTDEFSDFQIRFFK